VSSKTTSKFDVFCLWREIHRSNHIGVRHLDKFQKLRRHCLSLTISRFQRKFCDRKKQKFSKKTFFEKSAPSPPPTAPACAYVTLGDPNPTAHVRLLSQPLRGARRPRRSPPPRGAKNEKRPPLFFLAFLFSFFSFPFFFFPPSFSFSPPSFSFSFLRIPFSPQASFFLSRASFLGLFLLSFLKTSGIFLGKWLYRVRCSTMERSQAKLR
jgi:hypothetical protein